MIGDVEVRTAPRDHHKLIVHFEETDDRKHVLVVGQRPQFTIVGWLRGREAARDEWIESWREGGHSFFVPQSALHPIAELQVLLTQEIYDDVPDVLA